MRPDFAQTPEADVAMPAQLFAIGKTALHRFLAAFINSFTVIFITMGGYFIESAKRWTLILSSLQSKMRSVW